MEPKIAEGYALCIDMLSGFPAIYPLVQGWQPKVGEHVPPEICDGEGDVRLVVVNVLTPADTAYSLVHFAYKFDDIPALAELSISLLAFANIYAKAGSKFHPTRELV